MSITLIFASPLLADGPRVVCPGRESGQRGPRHGGEALPARGQLFALPAPRGLHKSEGQRQRRILSSGPERLPGGRGAGVGSCSFCASHGRVPGWAVPQSSGVGTLCWFPRLIMLIPSPRSAAQRKRWLFLRRPEEELRFAVGYVSLHGIASPSSRVTVKSLFSQKHFPAHSGTGDRPTWEVSPTPALCPPLQTPAI